MTLAIKGTSLGNPTEAAKIAIRRGGKKPDHIRRYAHALWDACDRLGVRADVAFAQADVETGDRETGVGFQSARWIEEGNPAGLGIWTGKPDSVPGAVRSPEQWAIIHAVHLAGYAGIDPPASWRDLDFRWEPMIRAGYFGVATVVHDLDERWAEDVGNYGDKIASRWRLYDFSGHTTNDSAGNGTGGTGMALERFRPIGLDRDIYLPSELDVQNKEVRHSRVRSYQKFTSQNKTTIHDTGNDRTDVVGEWSWLAGGRSGAGAGGYNAITDAYRIWFPVPHNEVTWHAGTALGNRTSWGVEWAYGKDKGAGRFDKSLEANMRLHGAYCAAMDWDPIEQAVLHRFWYGKYCSRQILDRGLIDEINAMMLQFAAEARRAATGSAEPPAEYAKPVRIAALDDALSVNLDPDKPALTVEPRSVLDPSSGVRFFWVGDRVRTTKTTPRYRFATEGAASVGPDLPPNVEFDVDWVFLTKDDTEWYLTPWATRVLAKDTIRTSDLKSTYTEAA